jgi:serine/threonine protein kinase
MEDIFSGYCQKKFVLINGKHFERTCLIIPPSSSPSSHSSDFSSSEEMVYEIDDNEIYLPLHGLIRLGYLLYPLDSPHLYSRCSPCPQIVINIFRKSDIMSSLSLDNNLAQQLTLIQYSNGTHPNILCKLHTAPNVVEGSYLCVLDEINCYLLMKIADIQLISSFQDRHVAEPLEFMSPTIQETACRVVNVIDVDGNGKQSTCLMTDLSLGSRSGGGGVAYEFEDRVYKSAAYGCVQRGWIVSYLDDSTYLRTTELYQIVIKRYSKQMMAETVRADNPFTEFAALQYVGEGHQNVLGQIACLEDEQFYYSITKFCNGGELTERIEIPSSASSGGGVNQQKERQVRLLFHQLLDGLEYLQSRGIYHRDLSLENLLITDNNQLLIIDLGMSLWVPYDTLIQTPHFIPKMDPPKGKKQYVSPEALSNSHPFEPYRSDLWSCGVILFVLLSGRFPVQVASPLCPFFRCIAGGGIGQIFRKYQIQISGEAMDLLAHMLSVDPMRRYTIDQIRAHPWMLLR